MTRYRIYPYKQGSRSAKVLADELGGKVLKHVNSKYRPRRGDVVLNWGAGDFGNYLPATTLNSFGVRKAANKLLTLQALSEGGVRVPTFCTTSGEAENLLKFPVVCRTKLTGHSGEGIVIADKPEDLVPAPLYTQYVPKKQEYRVHVMAGKAFFIQRKARRADEPNPDWKIRNLKGGFVFVEDNGPPPDVVGQAIKSVEILGLDFGAADVLWNDKEQRAYVIEVNTACGLEDRTAAHYREAIVALNEG